MTSVQAMRFGMDGYAFNKLRNPVSVQLLN